MDFMERLNDAVNEIPGLLLSSSLGFLEANESLVVYPLPGSSVVEEYMDGTTDEKLLYEIAMKSKSQGKINGTLWLISRSLVEVKDIVSNDGSFQFNGLRITNLPFVNNADDQGWYEFRINIQASITNYEKGEYING